MSDGFRNVRGLPRVRPQITGTADESTPAYYKGKGGSLQALDVVDEFDLGFYFGNVVTYILRHRGKGGIQDVRKALHYLNLWLDRIAPPEPDDDQAG